MPKDGTQLRIMMENLDAQERALLQTFEGTMVSDTVETIITYVPQPDEERIVLFRFSQHLGITDADDVKMAGSPKHSANASLYFEKWGINLRLSYNYASSFIDQMNTGSRQLDRYYDDVNYLDINASYSWGRKIRYSIFAEANNLLNQPLRYYQGVKDRTMQVEYYGVKLTAGFKINL